MKRLVYALFLCAFFALASNEAKAQCNADAQIEKCVPKLMEGFNFMKSYKVDGEGGAKSKIEYSYVFAKGTQYNINICTPGDNVQGLTVSLYDSNRKLVSTNVMNGKFFNKLIYPCNATGIYYITFTFDDSAADYCGGAVLGFKR